MTKYFNFNNEEYTLTIEEAADGTVSFVANGTELHFDNIQSLAENYALARNVKTDNLKNWVLVEDGDYYSFVLRAATAGVDFFSQEPSISWNEDDDFKDKNEYEYEYEYENEDELLSLHHLNDKERTALGYMLNTDDEDELTAAIYDNEDLYDQIKELVAKFEKLGRGNFNLGFKLVQTIKEVHEGTLPEQVTEEANRQLTMAAVARRDSFQVMVVNLTEGSIADGQRLVNTPFRPTELVTKIEGVYVVFER